MTFTAQPHNSLETVLRRIETKWGKCKQSGEKETNVWEIEAEVREKETEVGEMETEVRKI